MIVLAFSESVISSRCELKGNWLRLTVLLVALCVHLLQGGEVFGKLFFVELSQVMGRETQGGWIDIGWHVWREGGGEEGKDKARPLGGWDI